jgi:putative FmdB family regulatory protein
MPLFELECTKCNHRYETILKHKDDLTDEKCPKCGCIQLQACFNLIGSYNIKGNNSASERPNMTRRMRK